MTEPAWPHWQPESDAADARAEAEELRLFQRDVRRGICGHTGCDSPREADGSYCTPCREWWDAVEAKRRRVS